MLVRAIVRAATMLGASAPELLARMGLSEAELGDVDERLPAEHTLRGWAAVEELTGDPLFGLHVAQYAPIGVYGVLDWATRSAGTVADGLHQVVRYFRVVSDLSRMRIEPRDGGVRLCHRLPATVVSPRHASEAFLATVIARGRMHSGVELRPRVVRFAHPRPAPTQVVDAVEAFFTGRVEWGSAENELELDDDVLRTPFLTAEPGLHEVLERHARELVAKLPPSDGVVDQVRALIAEALRAGDPSLDHVARRLATSPRTLQRRLQAEGTSFEALLDPERQAAAVRYLGEPALSIGEVAFLLGYHDASTFNRAFKRWTGAAPSAWRKARTPR